MKPLSGFTLIELLVTLAVLSILIAIAAPNFNNVTGSNKLTTEANNFLSGLTYARSEAVTRNLTVSVVVGDSTIAGAAITPGTTWKAGWRIYSAVPAGTSLTLLRQSSAMPSNFTTSTISMGGTKQIDFRSDGSASPGMDIKICDNNQPGANTGRTIQVTSTGLAFVKTINPSCP